MAVDDANTVVLLHFDGLDASTTFTDESGKTRTPVGDAQLDTAQKVFGTASGLFDGTGDYISTGSSSDFAFGTGPFTIDFRARWAVSPVMACIACIGYVSAADKMTAYWQGNQIKLGLPGYDVAASSAWLPSVDTWYHIAIVREADYKVYFYVDGVAKGTGLLKNASISAGAAFIGSDVGGATPFNGWIDEFRVSNVARWTTNFTPPTSAYVDADVSIWANRLKLTIDSSKIDTADLTDFPVMVHLSAASGIGDADVSAVFDELASDANRKKIAVTTSDGTTQCYVEIEKWDDANEVAWLHVKVPTVAYDADTDPLSVLRFRASRQHHLCWRYSGCGGA